ncbi:flagellar hook-basal body protein [Agrobacterium sp. SORGH_AS 745]|nr:flagellar hook-basal body protein [Agrobacterium sp. SORGH_AS_0745]
MSIFGTMRTGVSGMNAQANKLGTVGDNIANASTTGYKRASTSFSSLVLPSSSGSYASGGVQSNVRYSISEQGNLSYTTSSTDLAIQGNGFFVVQDGGGTPYLTRAGSFVKNAEGYLENAAGFQLMGYPYGANAPAAVVNGFTGLEAVNVNNFGLTASPSTQGSFPANLNRDEAAVAAGSRPSDNLATSTIGNKTSLTAYDSGGAKGSLRFLLHQDRRQYLGSGSLSSGPVDQWRLPLHGDPSSEPCQGISHAGIRPGDQ